MAAALPLVMAAVSAVGTFSAGQSQKKMADYNAAVSEQDAIAAKNKAGYEENIHRERVKEMLSKQRAIIGASGTDVSGSPLLAMIDTAEKGELDALAIRQGGKVQSDKFLNSAALSRMQGKSARNASYFKAGSTLLTGGYKAYKAA